jgi:hypothetical protein
LSNPRSFSSRNPGDSTDAELLFKAVRSRSILTARFVPVAGFSRTAGAPALRPLKLLIDKAFPIAIENVSQVTAASRRGHCRFVEKRGVALPRIRNAMNAQ